MHEGPVGVDRTNSATAQRQPTPSSAIYPRQYSGSSGPSGGRVASASSRRTISRTGSSRRPRYRKDGARSVEVDGKGGNHEVGGTRLIDRLDSDAVDIYNDYGWDTDLEAEPSSTNKDESEIFEGRNSSNGGPTLQIYLDACKQEGVTPASYFLRHVADEHLSMKHHYLGPRRVKPLATALASSAIVLSLDLDDNWLEDEGGVILCAMLKENSYISELDLSNNNLGATFARCFADVVLSNSTLTSVTLSGNHLDDAAAVHLAEAIAGSGALEYLDLSKNRLGDSAGVLLGPAIADNCSLKYLILSFNSLRNKGAAAVAMGIKNNVLLKSADLSWNGFALAGAKALGEALRVNTTLEELDITNNRLTTEAATLISKGLAVNEALKTLKIGKNPLQHAGCLAIAAALLKNPNSSIRRLDFTDISVNEEVNKILSQLQERNPDLSYVTEVDPLTDNDRSGRRGLAAHPVARLRSYLAQAGIEPVELFSCGKNPAGLTAPPRTVIDRDQFCDIIKSLEQLAFSENDLDELVECLAVKGRDLVDYSELIAAERPISYYTTAGTPARPVSGKSLRPASGTTARTGARPTSGTDAGIPAGTLVRPASETSARTGSRPTSGTNAGPGVRPYSGITAGVDAGSTAGSVSRPVSGTIDEANGRRSALASAKSYRTSSSLSSGDRVRSQRSGDGSGQRGESGRIGSVERIDANFGRDDDLNRDASDADGDASAEEKEDEQNEADDEDEL